MNKENRPNRLQHLLPLIKQSIHIPATQSIPEGVQSKGIQGAIDVLSDAKRRVNRMKEQQKQ